MRKFEPGRKSMVGEFSLTYLNPLSGNLNVQMHTWLPEPSGLPMSIKVTPREVITLEERIRLCTYFCLPYWIQKRRSIAAREILIGVPCLNEVYKTDGSLSAFMMNAVANHGLGLQRNYDGNFPANYWNGRQLVLLMENLWTVKTEDFVAELGYGSARELCDAVRTLPGVPVCSKGNRERMI